MTGATETMDENNPWRKWAQKRAEFSEVYTAAVWRSSAHREKMEQLKAIEEQLQMYVRETGRVREELKSLARAEETHRTERESWERLIVERDDALDAQCAKLTADSGGAILARMKRYADASDFVDGVKQAVSGSRVPGHKVEGLIQEQIDQAAGLSPDKPPNLTDAGDANTGEPLVWRVARASG